MYGQHPKSGMWDPIQEKVTDLETLNNGEDNGLIMHNNLILVLWAFPGNLS